MSLPALPARIVCRCGAVHTCDIRAVVCGAGAVAQVPALLADCPALVLVSDGNTAPLAGERLADALAAAGHTVHRAHFAATDPIIPNEAAIAHIEAALGPDTAALVGVGSGVINDLCKYVAHAHGLPYMIVATAPSMDGYASAGAAMTLRNLKVTTDAAPPAWIVGDTALLASAPIDMLRGGIGDLLGKYSCLKDWRLASLITGERFCQDIYDSVLAVADATARDIPAILARDEAAVGRLFEGLIHVGVAMSFAGSSRPASGSEHHLAHFFEITAHADGSPCLSHGINVGYGTLITERLRHALAAQPAPAPGAAPFDEARWRQGLAQVYGKDADAVAAAQLRTDFYTAAGRAARRAAAHDNWPAVQALLTEGPAPQSIAALLAAAGFDEAAFTQLYGPRHIADAVLYGKDLKQRYTVFNLLNDLDMLSDAAARLYSTAP